MIELSNGKKFTSAWRVGSYLEGMKDVAKLIKSGFADLPIATLEYKQGFHVAVDTAIAAIDVAIENARLDYKRALQKETKMKAAKKPAVKPVAKKPAIKKAVATKKKPTKKC